MQKRLEKGVFTYGSRGPVKRRWSSIESDWSMYGIWSMMPVYMPSYTLSPRYTPLVQKPFCCNVTCLMMILYRHGFGLFDQEALAEFFKIKIPRSVQAYFNVKLPHLKSKREEGGMRTIDSKNLVNKFFKKHKIQLHAVDVKASNIKNLHKFISEHLRMNHDLWVEYKSHEIHREDAVHDNVIESIRRTKTGAFVTLIDPFSEHKTRFEVPIAKIERAISDKFGRETGFLVITR